MARRYESPRRAAGAEAARRRILLAARRLFATRGIDRVTVAAIAGAARVGASTVYAAYRSKAGILRALMTEALFGPRYREAQAHLQGEADPVALATARTAAVACAVYQGETEVLGLVRGASAFSPELREVEEEFETLRHRMQAGRVRALRAAGLLAPGLTVAEARRILWALTGRELHRSLVTVGGWSPARYRRWLAEAIRSQLIAPPHRARSTRGVHMAKRRVVAPAPPAKGEKPKGPASYFPSIEKTYGKPVQHWLDLAVALLEEQPHMEVVATLKREHGLGHGHANAVVAYAKAALAGG